MRKKPLILVAFLMMSLCMIPSVTAGYGDESPQSITSFSETLPDDVLFYPDAIINDTVHVADTGTGDYADSQVLDSTYWSTTLASLEEAEFHLLTTIQIEMFSYAFYGHCTVIEGWLKIQNDADAWVILEEIATGGDAWYNGTVSDPDYFKTDNEIHFAILDDITGDGATIECDYLEISYVSYMTLADSDHYAESFADVSDWEGSTWATSDPEGTFTSDGDVGSIEDNDSGVGSDNDGWISNDLSYPDCNYYLEIRYKVNITTSVNPPRIYFFSLDDSAGTLVYIALEKVTSWTTYRCQIADAMTGDPMAIESMILLLLTRAGDSPIKWDIDYLRISPANETGWQHDGSTIVGVSGDAIITTDGDKLTISAVGNTRYADFVFDTTATSFPIDTDYYPFLSWSITAVHDDNADGDVWYARAYDTGSVHLQNVYGYCDETGIFRFNAAQFTALNDFAFMRIYVRIGDNVTFDWMKGYSIANFSYTQSVSCSISDVFYVDSGALIGSKTTDYYQTFNYDPVLSVDTTMYNIVEANVSKAGYPNVVGFNWAATITGIGETWYLVDEKRTALDSSVMTDNRFSIDGLGDWTLYTIAFVDDHTWRGYTTVTVWFEVIAFTGTLGMLLIFGGLFLIPASTLYAVKGGREAMNTDKLFYVLIAFVLGWAFLLGGIFG